MKHKAIVYKEFTSGRVRYKVGDILDMEYHDYYSGEEYEISQYYVVDRNGNWLCDEESDFFFDHMDNHYEN